jgi:hypothetical protein
MPDLAVGATGHLYNYESSGMRFVWNPKVFVTAATYATLTFHFFIVELTF